METQTHPYRQRLQRFEVEKNANCPNYIKAIAFAKENGYSLSDDISYNGFILFKKTLCETEDPFDGNQLEIKVYDGTDNRKWHHVEQNDKEAIFGNIMDKTRYMYKTARGLDKSISTQNLDELFVFALNREKALNEEHILFKLEQKERNELWEKNPELKDKHYADLLSQLRK